MSEIDNAGFFHALDAKAFGDACGEVFDGAQRVFVPLPGGLICMRQPVSRFVKEAIPEAWSETRHMFVSPSCEVTVLSIFLTAHTLADTANAETHGPFYETRVANELRRLWSLPVPQLVAEITVTELARAGR